MLPTIRRRNAPGYWRVGDDFDRFFNLAFSGAPSLSEWSPPVDVHETDDAFVIEVELPGVGPDQVDVSIEDGTLSISGEKKNDTEGDVGGHIRERRYGAFERSFSLPRSADPAKVDARFEYGVLRVELSKAATARPRKIEISA